MSYAKYPKEMKEAIIIRLLSEEESVTDIQRDTGIGINTLYRWRDQARNKKGFSAASELIRRIYRDEKVYLNKEPLVLHSDNGSPMKGATMMETLYTLGIIPSRSRPRVSNDNPYAESLFKTLKYVPNYQPKWFASLEEARVWVKHFVEWYNNEHRHSGINYVTPNERYNGMDKEILEKRKIVYEQAKAEHPERWAKETRDWTCAEEEWLNPRQENEIRKGA